MRGKGFAYDILERKAQELEEILAQRRMYACGSDVDEEGGCRRAR